MMTFGNHITCRLNISTSILLLCSISDALGLIFILRVGLCFEASMSIMFVARRLEHVYSVSMSCTRSTFDEMLNFEHNLSKVIVSTIVLICEKSCTMGCTSVDVDKCNDGGGDGNCGEIDCGKY